jgi:ribosome-binding protein aMBF1 (putative translation factor)
MKYEVGQKIKVRDTYSLTSAVHNQVGVVKHVDNVTGDIAVEFDFEFALGHDCHGHCASRRGQWFKGDSVYIELYHEPKFMLTDRIVYEGKKGTVVMVNEDLVHFILDEDVERTIVCSDNKIEKLSDFELQVGDIVKVVKTVCDKPNLLGKLGKIVKKIVYDKVFCTIEFFDFINGWDCREAPNSVGHCWCIPKEDLEFQSRENKLEKGETKMEFDVGQKVMYVGDRYPVRKYTTCTILQLNSNGSFVVEFADRQVLCVRNIKRLDLAKNLQKVFNKKYTIDNVVGVYPNFEKRVVVVKFDDDYYSDYIRINCSDEDHFDVNIAVALAIAYQNAGSKNKFRKKVEAKTKVVKSKVKKETNPEHLGFGFITSADAESDLEQVAKDAFDNMFEESNKALNDFLNIGLTYGQRLYRARKEKKLNQADVAKLVGTVPSTISDWERGKYRPKPDKRKILEKVLGM